MARTDRRSFLQTTLATGAAWAVPGSMLHAQSPNEQINLGMIGCGGRGGNLLQAFRKIPGVQIAGLCDADQARLQAAKAGREGGPAGFPKAKTWVDLRHMLDDQDIDAVAIATCNHWHCLAAIWAMQAGKHVYVEKPLAHVHSEGEQLIKATSRYQRICQVGTQQRSDPMQAEIKEFLHNQQALGPIRWVRANRYGVRNPIGKRDAPMKIPQGVDYNLWCGPASEQPIYRSGLHYDWHWDWSTGSGEMGNWGVHILDDVRNNAFLDEVALPRQVVAAGGRFAWDDAGQTPNFHFALLDTGGPPVVVALTNLPRSPEDDRSPQRPGPGSGYIVHCEGGRLEGHRGGANAFDADGSKIREFQGDRGAAHQQNFIDAVRSGDASQLNSPVQVGHHSTAWCNFANIAARIDGATGSGDPSQRLASQFGSSHPAVEVYDEIQHTLRGCVPDLPTDSLVLGPVLKFDGEAGEFVGDHSRRANQLLTREDRRGFEVPSVG